MEVSEHRERHTTYPPLCPRAAKQLLVHLHQRGGHLPFQRAQRRRVPPRRLEEAEGALFICVELCYVMYVIRRDSYRVNVRNGMDVFVPATRPSQTPPPPPTTTTKGRWGQETERGHGCCCCLPWPQWRPAPAAAGGARGARRGRGGTRRPPAGDRAERGARGRGSCCCFCI